MADLDLDLDTPVCPECGSIFDRAPFTEDVPPPVGSCMVDGGYSVAVCRCGITIDAEVKLPTLRSHTPTPVLAELERLRRELRRAEINVNIARARVEELEDAEHERRRQWARIEVGDIDEDARKVCLEVQDVRGEHVRRTRADADLIAHAPADIAALLVEVRRLRAEVDEAHAETGAVQDAVRATILEHIGAEHSNDIDGAGSDAGPVEFTVMEVRQGLGILQDRLDEVQRERDALRDAAKEAVERSARIRRMEMTEDDRQICAGVHADAAQWLADCLLGALGGAPYAEHQITVTVEAGTVEMVLTTRRKSEPTPHQLRRQAEQERDEARALAEERRVRLMLAGLEGAPEGWRRSGTRTEPGLCWSIGVGSYVDLTHRPHRPQHSRYFEVLSRVGPVRRHQFCGNALDAWTYAKFLRSHIEEHGALPPQETP